MGAPPDENLPEVVAENLPQTVPDSSPQALTAEEAQAHRGYLDGAAKIQDQDLESPKYTEVPVGLETAYYESHPRDPESALPWEPVSAVTALPAGTVGGSSQLGTEDEKPRDERICGMRKQHFYILIVVLVVLLAGVVGAGVGGGLAATAARNREAASAPQDGGNGNPAPGSPASTSSDLPPLPQPTGKTGPPKLNETRLNGPFKFQGWSQTNFTGNMTDLVRGIGITDFTFNISSYIWDTNGYTCCLTFCNGPESLDGAYWCGTRSQPKSSAKFNRIVTLCGGLEITTQPVSCS